MMTFEDLLKKVAEVKKLELINHEVGRTYLQELYMVADGDRSVPQSFGWIAKHSSINGEPPRFFALYQQITVEKLKVIAVDMTPEQLFVLRSELSKKSEVLDKKNFTTSLD